MDVYVQAWRWTPVCSGLANIRSIISKLFHPYHSHQLIYIAVAATARFTKQISWCLQKCNVHPAVTEERSWTIAARWATPTTARNPAATRAASDCCRRGVTSWVWLPQVGGEEVPSMHWVFESPSIFSNKLQKPLSNIRSSFIARKSGL